MGSSIGNPKPVSETLLCTFYTMLLESEDLGCYPDGK